MRRFITSKGARSTGVRVGIRLPDGKRVIHMLDASDSITTLYAFVDSQFIPDDLESSGDPSSAPASSLQGESAIQDEISHHAGGPQHWWGFQLALTYPRKELGWKKGVKVSDIEGLESGGQVVVEMISATNGNGKARKSQESLQGDSDEYDTESDEE